MKNAASTCGVFKILMRYARAANGIETCFFIL